MRSSDVSRSAIPDASSSWPASRVAVSGAFLANGLVLGSWTPHIPVFASRLGLGETQLGILIFVFGIGAVLAMPVVGAVMARFGSKRITLTLHVLLSFALPLLILAPSPWLAAAAILFFGMTMGGMDVAMNSNAVSVERRLPRAMMSSCHGFWSVGGFLGAALGGVLIARLGPVPHAVLVAIVMLALTVPISRHLLEDRDPSAARDPSGAGGSAEGNVSLRNGAVLTAVAVGVCALLSMVPEGSTIDWSAIYLRDEVGASIATSGFGFAAFSATMALCRFLGDGVRDRLGAVLTVRLSVVIGIAGLVLVASAGSLPLALLGFAVMGVGLSNLAPVAFSAAGNIHGLRPGVAISIATTIGYSGILVAPSAIGFFAEHFGFRPVFLGLCACLAVVALLAGVMRGADRSA